eukprot:INCI7715.1.p1 GENE.INCI7715.1~~INCI7715.1.p1  ORF type:complete len:794 (+),score=143.16 INCI7715.1:668-3049(+)
MTSGTRAHVRTAEDSLTHSLTHSKLKKHRQEKEKENKQTNTQATLESNNLVLLRTLLLLLRPQARRFRCCSPAFFRTALGDSAAFTSACLLLRTSMERAQEIAGQVAAGAHLFLLDFANMWLGLGCTTRLFLSVVVFVAGRKQLREEHFFGPITASYLVTLLATVASALLVWHTVEDWKDVEQLVRVAVAYAVVDAALNGGTLVLLLAIAATAYPVTQPYVLLPVSAVAIVTLLHRWSTKRRIPTVDVDMTPELPAESTKVPTDFRIDSVPGTVQCVNPCTHELLGELPAMDAEAVEAAISAAAKAQKDWQRTSFEERRHVLRTMQRWILDHQSEIVRLCCLDSGKSAVGASVGEVIPTLEKIAWVLRDGEAALRPSPRPTGPGIMTLTKCAWVEYVPFGVLGIIAPWNYPFHNFMNHVISGLFSGNAIVAKPSEFTSWSGQYFVRMVKAVLTTCGHSPDLVQCVTGHADTGRALVASKGIKKIIFTGSGPVGKHVMRGAAPNLTPVVLELGGKDPAIVCDDANIGQLLPLLMRGAFQNAGQNCMGLERVYAHEAVHDELVRRAEIEVRKVRQGNPLCADGCCMGSMVTPPQLAHVDELVRDAIANGARALVGGKISQNKDGYFFEPTLLVDVKNEMRIVQEEVFGPVMLVIKWHTDNEVIDMANATDYGLAMSVFSADRHRAERITRSVDSGVGNVNDFGANYLCQSLPFGGVKGSGFGRFAGKEGLRACCYTKSMTGDLFSFLQTNVPPVLQYPVNATSVRFSAALAHLSYETTVVGRLKGLVSLLQNLTK